MNNRDLNEIRKEIDKLDEALVSLFIKRMEISLDVAEYKSANDLPVDNPAREKEVLRKVAASVPEPLEEYAQALFQTLFAISKDYQREYLARHSEVK